MWHLGKQDQATGLVHSLIVVFLTKKHTPHYPLKVPASDEEAPSMYGY